MQTEFIGNINGFGPGYAGAVWNAKGLSPTLTTMQGGGRQPMIIEKIEEVSKLGFIDKGTGEHESNIVYDNKGVAPCVTASFGVKQPPTMHIEVEKMIVAQRGRDTINPSHRGPATENYEQRLEPNTEGISNTITTVQKDNLVLEAKQSEMVEPWIWDIDGVRYLIRIRKLTPLECWRLMSFTDENFNKAAAVNSNTQLYKQAGNSICKEVIKSIFRMMM